MLPGKKYTPEDFLKIVYNRLWWLVVPCAIAAAGAAVYAHRLPDMYWSETSIMVVPQRVPDNYVRSTVTSRIEDRLEAIKPSILSRTRLEQIIQEFNLYAPQRASGMLMEDVIARMRLEILISVTQGDAFKISYIGPDPAVVKGVTDRLARLFIDENLRDRTTQAESTNQFLEGQLAEAKRKLQETEQRLASYRRAYSGELPEQLQSNLALVQNANTQLHQLAESVDGDQDRRIVLEQQLASLQGVRPDSQADPASSALPSASSSTLQQLAQAKENLDTLSLKLRPGHPDLERARRAVTDLEARLAEEARSPQSQSARALSPAELDRRRRIAELQQQLQEINVQVARKQAESARLRTVAQDLQRRVDAVPTRESELIELNRDYSILEQQYSSLLQKKEESRIAVNLESRQIGEQFRLLDPARQAERPFSPNRLQINLMGAGAGLALGLLLVAVFEYRDTTLKTDDDVSVSLGLPVVAVVPLMESDEDHRRAVRYRVLLGLGLGGTVAGCVAVLLYTLVR